MNLPSTLPPPPVYARGFDISKYSGNVDFGAFARDGFEFVIIRSTVGLSIDPKFEGYAKAALDAKLIVGTYDAFFTTLDPEKQAEVYVGHIRSLGSAVMAPCLDFELLHGIATPTALDRALAFQRGVEQQMAIPETESMVYTYPNFWDQLPPTQEKLALSRRKLAIAHYGVDHPRVPSTFSDWTIWQHAGNVIQHGAVVDLDCFKGTSGEIPLYQAGSGRV
jgi:lysozyme